jgi:hypothetical protein
MPVDQVCCGGIREGIGQSETLIGTALPIALIRSAQEVPKEDHSPKKNFLDPRGRFIDGTTSGTGTTSAALMEPPQNLCTLQVVLVKLAYSGGISWVLGA